MHDLPLPLFGSQGHSDPQIARGHLLCSAHLGVGPLYPQDAGQLGGHVFPHDLEVVDLAISIVRGATLLGLCDLIPPACGRAEGVGEGHVISMGEEILQGLWVPLHELVTRSLESFEYLVEIVYGGHLDITSIVEAVS